MRERVVHYTDHPAHPGPSRPAWWPERADTPHTEDRPVTTPNTTPGPTAPAAGDPFPHRLRYGQTGVYVDAATVRVTGRCYVTGEPHSVDLPAAGLIAWLGGELAQVALASAPKEDREFVMSSTSPAGWAMMAGDEDDA